MEKPVLSITRTGTKNYPRYLILNQDDHVWDGKSFVPNKQKAKLFADLHEACRRMQDVLLDFYVEKRRKRFVVPIYIDLYADDDVDQAELIDWLHKSHHLHIDTPNCGNGPRDGLVTSEIVWNEISLTDDDYIEVKNNDQQ